MLQARACQNFVNGAEGNPTHVIAELTCWVFTAVFANAYAWDVCLKHLFVVIRR